MFTINNIGKIILKLINVKKKSLLYIFFDKNNVLHTFKYKKLIIKKVKIKLKLKLLSLKWFHQKTLLYPLYKNNVKIINIINILFIFK